jgi:hypothetical protein
MTQHHWFSFKSRDKQRPDEFDGSQCCDQEFGSVDFKAPNDDAYVEHEHSHHDEEFFENKSATQGDNIFGLSYRFSTHHPRLQCSDERIENEILHVLAHNPEVDAVEIDVEVLEGDVTLTGTVPEYKMKKLAELGIAHCFGVNEITNHLRVARIHPELRKERDQEREREKDLRTRTSNPLSPH